MTRLRLTIDTLRNCNNVLLSEHTSNFGYINPTELTSPSYTRGRQNKRSNKMPGPGPSRKRSDSEDMEEVKVGNNEKRTRRQTVRKEKSANDGNSNDIIRTISESSSSETLESSSDSDFQSSSDDEIASLSSETSHPASPPGKAQDSELDEEKVDNARLTRNFRPWEQRTMLRYLITKKLISKAKGNEVWKRMIEDGYLQHRTVLSLNNHFRKSILPNLERFKMKRQNMEHFKNLLK